MESEIRRCSKKKCYSTLCFLTTLFLLLLFYSEPFRLFNDRFFDYWISTVNNKRTAISEKDLNRLPKILLINLDKNFAEQIKRYPFPRKYYDLTLKVLKEKSPLAIGLPLVFCEDPEDDNDAVILPDSNVIFGAFYYKFADKIIGPDNRVKCSEDNFGLLNVSLDPDGQLRQLSPLSLNFNNKSYDHFVVKLAKKLNFSILSDKKNLIVHSLTGKMEIPQNGFYINYYSPVLKNIEHINYLDFYEKFILNDYIKSLRNHIVIVGVDVPGYTNYWKTSDLKYNNSNYVIAVSLLNFLYGDVIKESSKYSTALITSVIALIFFCAYFLKLNENITKKNVYTYIIILVLLCVSPFFVYYYFLIKLDYFSIYLALFGLALFFGLYRFQFYASELNHQCSSLNINLEDKLKMIENLQNLRNNYIREISDLSTNVKNYESKFQTNNNFIQNLSHEIKNPLAPISGYARLLKNETNLAGNSHILEWISAIERNANRIETLINKIRYISQIENNQAQINIEKIDIPAFLNEIINEYIQNKKILSSREIEINFNINGQNYIFADRKLFEQVFINLFDNSLKYSEETEPLKINISIISEKNNMTIKIEDYGFGLTTNNPADIFARFYRDSNAAKNAVSGEGIGLNIVSEIIKLHSGKIYAENKGVNKGIIITINLSADSMRQITNKLL
ncbi:MAG TPA: CHASE2 domain-containing protein [bacterium]|nr:CHASE2 domain-containing protein [bacterium]